MMEHFPRDSFRLVVVVCRRKWHFSNGCFDLSVAYRQCDFGADGFEIVAHIAHGHISAQAWARAAAGNDADLLVVAEYFDAVPCRCALLHANADTSARTAAFQLFHDFCRSGEISLSSTTFCCEKTQKFA